MWHHTCMLQLIMLVTFWKRMEILGSFLGKVSYSAVQCIYKMNWKSRGTWNRLNLLPEYFFHYCIVLSAVEKNNDAACNVVRRKCNNWDSLADVLRMEHRQSTLYHREGPKRQYSKQDTDCRIIRKREHCKARKQVCLSNVVVEVETEAKQAESEVETYKKAKKNGKSRKKKKKRKCKWLWNILHIVFLIGKV